MGWTTSWMLPWPTLMPCLRLNCTLSEVTSRMKYSYYYMECYPLDSIPNSDEELCDWLCMRWSEKEERLKYFYSHRLFPDEEQQLEKNDSIAGLYQAILFIVMSNVFVAVMLYYSFYYTLAYIILSLSWLSYGIISNGAVDTLLLNEIYKHIITKSAI